IQGLDAVAGEDRLPALGLLDDGARQPPVHGGIVHHEHGVKVGRSRFGARRGGYGGFVRVHQWVSRDEVRTGPAARSAAPSRSNACSSSGRTAAAPAGSPVRPRSSTRAAAAEASAAPKYPTAPLSV